MKIKDKRFKMTAVVLTAILAGTAFAGCSGKKEEKGDTQSSGQVQESQIQEKDETDPLNGEALKFKPAEMGLLPQEKYEYPYLGLSAVLSETLLAKMESRDVLMLTEEEYNPDGTVKYALMQWYALTEEQKNEETEALDLNAWKAGLARIGALGVCDAEAAADLDELTGCTEHKELGKSEDGSYTYHLSFADGADAELKKELEKTEVTLMPMEKMPSGGDTAFSEGRTEASNIGDFKTTDINGKEYTKDLFQEYDLTLVNVFATWCSPCVEEMPELEKLKQVMNEKGVNVAGVVYDTVIENGDTDEGAMEKAKMLEEKAGLTFPLLKPDETKMNGRLKGINSFPESFFVDKDGNIVGETYTGARSFEDWKEIVEKELANLKGES